MQISSIYIVMGVSGSGKTTVGKLLAERLELPFHDADDFHPAANIEKMSNGIPLDDDDRAGWLADMAKAITKWETTGGAVLACSALKEAYRQTLQGGARQSLRWVFLDGSRELLSDRIEHRKGHYMAVDMLDSQLETLEKPAYGLHIELRKEETPKQVTDKIMQADIASETKPA
ncbi:gluconokinase [Hymenobacter sp. NBH84]|uniref:gluconokinase n=1 Tax=Hymenobacter sp. NBH84 TaxID=2596915 RepID=UPI0016248F06|nr:gluconokinase [Hymenobacter sp. NBH84]QNE40630.1 gluconokinase [Hymenobacter sp. NBH84]